MKKFLYLLLAADYLLLITGCGKKQPIGYEMVKPRESEIKLTKAEIIPPYPVHSEFASTKGSHYLFTGKEAGFDAIAFIYFEFESLETPESLWVIGRTTGILQIYKVMDPVNIDSVNWSLRPNLQYFNALNVNEAETTRVSIKELGPDTLFYIAFWGSKVSNSDTSLPLTGIVSFERPWISIESDTFSHKPMKSTYIDTSYLSRDSIPDSLTYIETGAFVTQCTLYLKLYLIESISADSTDTVWTQIDSLTDSLRKVYRLDSATINKAEFKILIDETHSYKKGINILAKYEVGDEKVFSSSSKVEEDTLTLSIKFIVEKWFTRGNKLWLVLEGNTKELSRVVLIPRTAKFFIVYTLPPKPRE